MKIRALVLGLIVLFLLTGCRDEEGASPTAAVKETPVVLPTAAEAVVVGPVREGEAVGAELFISELLPGIPGNNNYEFVELFNPTGSVIDLEGWSLWYQLSDGQAAQLVYQWESRADMPAYSHYLLVRQEQEISVTGDAAFETPLAVKGGLVLRDAEGQTVDKVGWGDAPVEMVAGWPASTPQDGASLRRQNLVTTGSNATDFTTQEQPEPQNTGSVPAWSLAAGERPLRLQVDLPAVEAKPGQNFELSFTLVNESGDPQGDLLFSVPLPGGFELVEAPSGATLNDGRVEWTVAELPAGETTVQSLLLAAPWTYTSTTLSGAYVETEGSRAYTAPLSVVVAGGAIPIEVARTLVGQVVTVEGTATMYTGGFFAGSSGTKFYLEDETGGIQVYVPGGQGRVVIDLGDSVQVTGKIELYRDSLELIPLVVPDDVVLLETAAGELEPVRLPIGAANDEQTAVGRLVEVEGTITRIQEFAYSYEIELAGEAGDNLLVYVEKDTGISVEPLEAGQNYRVSGISEFYNGRRQLMPRVQADFARVMPPVLLVRAKGPEVVPAGGVVTYTVSAANYMTMPLNDLELTVTLPANTGTVRWLGEDGEQVGDRLVWPVEQLAADGAEYLVQFGLEAEGVTGEMISLPPVMAQAAQLEQPVLSEPVVTFIGRGLPIWAIQGEGDDSPYVRSQVTTEGVVTAIFPGLDGFWVQETATDENPATSSGLFVLAGEGLPEIAGGDRLLLTGTVRELSGQTLLELTEEQALKVLGRDNVLPQAVLLDPPADPQASESYYETLEGMLVTIEEPAVAVAPTNRYGEYALVRMAEGLEHVWRDQPAGMLIIVDDGSEEAFASAEGMAYTVKSGDLVENLVGPLAYTFGQYKIEPLAPPTVQAATTATAPLPELAAEQFSIATYNVENLFDMLEPHPSDPPAPTAAEYRLKLARIAQAIVWMGTPTVVAVQEVENLDILEELAEQPLLAAYSYQAVLIEGTDSRGIDVGYLVRGDRAELDGAETTASDPGLTSRPPLLITVTLQHAGEPQKVYVINNHFTSMSAGVEQTEPQRLAQARQVIAVMEEVLAEEPDAWLAVTGDLNSFYDSPPLDLLREAGLRHVYEFIAPAREYSYIYQGQAQTLDHILLSPSLYEQLVAVEVLHINADYPLPAATEPLPYHTSDHDPVVARFGLRQP